MWLRLKVPNYADGRATPGKFISKRLKVSERKTARIRSRLF